MAVIFPLYIPMTGIPEEMTLSASLCKTVFIFEAFDLLISVKQMISIICLVVLEERYNFGRRILNAAASS